MRPISATHYQVRIPAHFAKLAEPIMDKAGIRNFPDFVRQAVMNQIRISGHANGTAPEINPAPLQPKEQKIGRGITVTRTAITAIEERAHARGENFSSYVRQLIERDLTTAEEQKAGK